ncbi:MAG: GIY-YIG nuclease family protein [Cyanobacteriota bacterium]|nr:GIY-YIG nuclease family protein [Cyanobacteriota bacterium]
MRVRQGELFAVPAEAATTAELVLQPHQLLSWQERISTFQAPLFLAAAGGEAGACEAEGQGWLFVESAVPTAGPPCGPAQADSPDLLALVPQPLSFWRWPEAPQRGAAIYLVIDQPPHLSSPLLLYVGETGRADRRWKGEHDCKSYLAAYGDALRRCHLASGLSIRFWVDVPVAVRPRRALEQRLIRHWQPPFNKETRSRWSTPFTAAEPA